MKDKKDIAQMEREMEAEFREKYEEEDRKIQAQINQFLKEKGDLDPDQLKDMPDDWVRMIIKIQIPETHMSLFRKTSTLNKIEPIMEIVSLGIFCNIQMGQDFKVIDFNYKKFNIDSVGQSGMFNYLLETVFPGDNAANEHALVFHME